MIFPVLFLLALLVAYTVLMYIYRSGWKAQRVFRTASGYRPKTRLSVLIPARNEAENIQACLYSILRNDYPRELMEIIVIDDFSEDATVALAKASLTYPGDKVLRLNEYLD